MKARLLLKTGLPKLYVNISEGRTSSNRAQLPKNPCIVYNEGNRNLLPDQIRIYSDYNSIIRHWYCSGECICSSLSVIFIWGMAQPPVRSRPLHLIFFPTACVKPPFMPPSAKMEGMTPS